MSRRARGEGTIYREAGPTRKTKWRGEKVVLLPDGRRKRIVARATTKDDVVLELKRRESRLLAANPEADRITVSEYLDKWLEYKRPIVKARTHAEYASTLRHARAGIGQLRLSRVRPTHVQEVLTSLSTSGQRATAANVRRYLKQAFRQAEKWGLLTVSPMRNIDPVKVPPVKRAVLQPREIQPVLEAARTVTPTYYPMVHTAILTGLRIGELVALPWANVKPDRIVVDRTHSKYAPQGFERPKTTSSHRFVPIMPRTYEIIREGRRHSPESPWAFPSRNGSMLGMRNVHRAFATVRGHAGVELRFHDLRRTAATLWALNGATPKMIQMLLGHSTPHLALAIYTDVMDDQLQGAALDPDSIGGESGGKTIGNSAKGIEAEVDDPSRTGRSEDNS